MQVVITGEATVHHIPGRLSPSGLHSGDDHDEDDELQEPPAGSSLLGGRRYSGDERPSMIDDDVRDAWITKGWTLRTSIHRHAGDGLKSLSYLHGYADKTLEDQLQEGQRRLNELIEVNNRLQSTFVNRKMKMREIQDKIDGLIVEINAARGVEEDARQAALAAMEDKILEEEKQKQDMQLELSQNIRECEEKAASVTATNEALAESNSRNKKMLKEQQAEIKERQKSIRHLQRQIHVLEGAQRSMDQQVGGIPEHGSYGALPDIHKRGTVHLDDLDAHGVLASHREKATAAADSKSLLRGAQAEKYLQEQKRLLQEQKMEKSEDRSRKVVTNISELKSLPGLNLSSLLSTTSGSFSEHAMSPKSARKIRADSLPE